MQKQLLSRHQFFLLCLIIHVRFCLFYSQTIARHSRLFRAYRPRVSTSFRKSEISVSKCRKKMFTNNAHRSTIQTSSSCLPRTRYTVLWSSTAATSVVRPAGLRESKLRTLVAFISLLQGREWRRPAGDRALPAGARFRRGRLRTDHLQQRSELACHTRGFVAGTLLLLQTPFSDRLENGVSRSALFHVGENGARQATCLHQLRRPLRTRASGASRRLCSFWRPLH